MALTKDCKGLWVCHCGRVSRNDGTDYDWVCDSWPVCETKA